MKNLLQLSMGALLVVLFCFLGGLGALQKTFVLTIHIQILRRLRSSPDTDRANIYACTH